MTATRLQSQETRTVRWRVPGILDRPAVGTSCCVSTAEAIIAQELSLFAGVADLTIDDRLGSVTVTFDPAQVREDDLAAALDEVGYPPER